MRIKLVACNLILDLDFANDIEKDLTFWEVNQKSAISPFTLNCALFRK